MLFQILGFQRSLFPSVLVSAFRYFEMKDIMNIQDEKYYGRTSLWINGTRKKMSFPVWDHILSAKPYVPQVRSQLEAQLNSSGAEPSVCVGISTNIF